MNLFLCYNSPGFKIIGGKIMSEEGKLIATIPRSSTEQMQIAVKEFKGKSYLDMRIFYTTDEGASWLPTKKGITCSPENLETLKDAVEEAMKELAVEEEG